MCAGSFWSQRSLMQAGTPPVAAPVPAGPSATPNESTLVDTDGSTRFTTPPIAPVTPPSAAVFAPPAAVPASSAPVPAAPPPAAPPPASPVGNGTAAQNLTAVFFECCESLASQGAWDAVEISWRLIDDDKTSDRQTVVPLANDPTRSAVEGCKSPMNCEQYIARDVAGLTVSIPEGIHYWTRLLSTTTNQTIERQYHGRTYDGDGDGQLEILVCGAMTAYESSSWFAYTCDPTIICNIVAHPCCMTGNCVSGDSGVPSSIGSWGAAPSAGTVPQADRADVDRPERSRSRSSGATPASTFEAAGTPAWEAPGAPATGAWQVPG